MSVAEIAGTGRVRAGLFGKIPARGDFVRAGLPRDFVQPWDDWLQRVIGGSRKEMGARWLPAWLEAPIWRFALPAGLCGNAAVLGLWMPSVDRAGRHFPLTLAMTLEDGGPVGTPLHAAWLARAEAAGLDALAEDLTPEAIATRVTADHGGLIGDAPPEAVALPDFAPLTGGQAVWWTDGSPLVPACVRAMAALPDLAEFIMMLDATSATDPPSPAGPDCLDGMEGT